MKAASSIIFLPRGVSSPEHIRNTFYWVTHSQKVSFIVKCAGWKQNKFLEDDRKSINNHRVKPSQSRNVLGQVHLKITNSIKIGLKETLKSRASVRGGGGGVIVCLSCLSSMSSFFVTKKLQCNFGSRLPPRHHHTQSLNLGEGDPSFPWLQG